MFSVDMQLFLGAPLLLFPLYFWGAWFTLIIVLIVGLTIACAATVAYFYEFSAFIVHMLLDFDKLMEFARMIFFATHIRMGPWLIGICCGYFVYKAKNGRLNINRVRVIKKYAFIIHFEKLFFYRF